MNPVAASLCFLIRLYQKTLAPFFGTCCRFEPSCSNYMLEAIRIHGVGYGVFLGLRRVAPVPSVEPRRPRSRAAQETETTV